MMLRRIARPMLAAWFVTEGVAAVRGAPAHLEPARAGVDALAEPVGYTRPSDAQLRTIVQVHGGLTVAAGAALVLGKAPRLAAVVLALLTFPTVLANLVASRRGTTSATAKAEHQQRAVRALSFTGAALIAAADREGRPGLAWKMSHAKQLAAMGAATGAAGLGRSGAKAGAKAATGSSEGGRGARKHSAAEEGHAVELTGRAARRAARATPAEDGAGAAAVRRPTRSEKKAARAAERADVEAVKAAVAQAAQAEKAARVAERAEARTAKVSRRSRRAEARAAARAAADVPDVVVA